MGVNWDLLQPIRPVAAQEVASVNGLLSAFAERRMKQQQFEAQQALAERSFQAQEANRQHDNANADAMLRLQQRQYESAQEQAKAAALAKDQDQARAELDKTILPALQNDRPDQAEASAIAAGVGFGKREADLAPGQVPPAAPTTRYNLTLPAGQVINYDPIEAENAKKAATAKLIDQSRAALEPTRRIDPYMNTAVDLALGLAPLYQKPEDVAKLATAEHDKAQAQAATAANALLNARGASDRHEDTAGQAAQRNLDRYVTRFATVNHVGDLQKAGTELQKSLDQLAPGATGTNQRAAIDNFITGIKKGTVTTAALQYFAKDVGSLGDRWQNFLSKWEEGKYGDPLVQEFQGAILRGLDSIKKEFASKARAFDKAYQNPSFRGLETNLDFEREMMFGDWAPPRASAEGKPGQKIGVDLGGKPVIAPAAASGAQKPASAETRARLQKLEDEVRAVADRAGGSQ